jgi:tetratricopeptide (TPR) repeat protein
MPVRAEVLAREDYAPPVVQSWATEFGDPSRTQGIPRRSDAGGGNPLHQRVLQLQATAGNAAVQRMFQDEAGEQAGGAGSGPSGAKAEGKPEILRYGSRGEAVKRLQERLNLSGRAGPELKVDGIMGALTTAAVREFQEEHPPLEVDGTAGPEVWAELERVGDQGAPMPGATAFDFFDKGQKLYNKGRYALAFDEFAKAFDLSPDPVYVFNMAQALRLVGGRRDEAIKLYERFLGMSPDKADADKANEQIAKLRGPGPSGDAAKDITAVEEIYKVGVALYESSEFGRAYDEFTKAWEINHDPALLWNRAVTIRAMGGRRAQAIALYEQVLTAEVPEDKKVAAKQELQELRGPGPSFDEKKDEATEAEIFKDAQAAYDAEDWATAYDGFTKAWQVTHSAEMVWNRAQALRLLGGRRDEAIKLYTYVLALDVPEETRKAARIFIAELKGPGKAVTGDPRRN